MCRHNSILHLQYVLLCNHHVIKCWDFSYTESSQWPITLSQEPLTLSVCPVGHHNDVLCIHFACCAATVSSGNLFSHHSDLLLSQCNRLPLHWNIVPSLCPMVPLLSSFESPQLPIVPLMCPMVLWFSHSEVSQWPTMPSQKHFKPSVCYRAILLSYSIATAPYCCAFTLTYRDIPLFY